MSYTTDNYEFTVPEIDDIPDISVLSQNWDNLDEILNGIDIRNKIETVSSTVDLNGYTEQGVYRFTSSHTPTNVPSGCTEGWLFVVPWNNAYEAVQFWLNYADRKVYIRKRVYPTWGEWNGLTTSAELSDIYNQLHGAIESNTALIVALQAAIGSPLVASSAESMTDQTKIYVYTGTTTSSLTNGHWYYWNGSAWADGGVYNSTALETDTTLSVSGMAADAEATGDEISDLKSAVNGIYDQIYELQTTSGTEVVVNSELRTAEITSETATLEIKHTGKNILAYPYTASSTTTHGLTFDVLSDGSVHVTGRGDQSINFMLSPESPSLRRSIKAGTYTLSGTPSNAGQGVGYVWLSGVGQGTLSDYGDGVTFVVTEDTTYYAKIHIVSDVDVDLLFKPMLEHGSTKSTWKPYIKETITLVDGRKTVQLFDDEDVFSALSPFNVTYYARKPEVNGYKSLKDYGAIGDGLHDDTEAINDAFSDAEGSVLVIPEGTYLFSETLTIKSGTRIVGCGDKSKFLLANTFTLTPYAWRTGDPLVTDQFRYPMICFDEDAQGCVLENFALQGQSATFYDKNCDGITIRGSNHEIRNLIITKINYFPSDFLNRVNNGVGYGIKTQDASNVLIENCYVKECGYECIGAEDTDNLVIIGCRCEKACQTTGQIHRNCHHIKVCNNVFDNTDCSGTDTNGPGFTLHASTDHPMSDVLIDGNYILSALVFANGGAENGIKITNNEMKGISLNAIDGYRNECMVIGNKVNGQLNLRCDNVIVGGNMVYHTGGGYMIRIYGNNVETFGNLALGNATAILTESHD